MRGRFALSLMAALFLLASLAAAQDYAAYRVLTGSEPNAWNAFNGPSDVWVDEPTGRIFVADPFNYAVQIFSTNLTYLTVLGGSPNGGLIRPESVMLSSDKKIYVVDSSSFASVKIFTSTYSDVGTIPTEAQSFQFTLPSGIAVDSAGNAYIADTGNGRIQVYDAARSYKDTLGKSGSLGDDVLNAPRGLFIKDGLLYIADTQNNRVKITHLDGSFVKNIGIGAGGVSLYYPYDVAVGIDNRIYVADTLNSRIVVFSPGGNPLSIITGNLSGKVLDKPRGVYVDSLDYVYIADTDNDRILIMRPLNELPSIALNASAEMDFAGAEIASFNVLVESTASFVNYTAGDMGALSYLALAQQHYAGKDYAAAGETARLSRAFIAEARGQLEGMINTSTRTRVAVIFARLDLYDRNISAGSLSFTTTSLRSQAQAVTNSLDGQNYPAAVSLYSALKIAADKLEKDINAALEGEKKGRAELMSSLDSLMGNVSALKARASLYKQELNTSTLDADISAATFALTRDLFASTQAYESALAQHNGLKMTLDDKVRAIVDANASIVYAQAQVATAEGFSGLSGKPDMTGPHELLAEAQGIIYSNPALAKQLAAQAASQATEQKMMIEKADEALKQGIMVLLAIVLVAIGVVFYVYKMKLRQGSSPALVERHYEPPAAPSPQGQHLSAPPQNAPNRQSAPGAQQPAVPYSPPRQASQSQPKPRPGAPQPKKK